MKTYYGVNSSQARLTEEMVTQARIFCTIGPKGTLPQLAKRWGVGVQTLRSACTYRNWKGVPPPTAQQIAETPLPAWLDMVGVAPRRHCGQCVHWEHHRSCTLGFPESGGFVASACSAFYYPLANEALPND